MIQFCRIITSKWRQWTFQIPPWVLSTACLFLSLSYIINTHSLALDAQTVHSMCVCVCICCREVDFVYMNKNQSCEVHLYKHFPRVDRTHNKLYGIKQVETAETIQFIQSRFAKVQFTKTAYSMGHINSQNYPAMQNGKKLLIT